jgi:cob(I)alamin adenosyltransferase
MSEPIYKQPKVVLNRIYTRRGDMGETSLAGGRRLGKDDPRIEAYGTVDELNAFLGTAAVSARQLAPSFPRLEALAASLRRVQHELFNLGAVLATEPEQAHPKQPQVTQAEVQRLEAEMDAMNAELPALRSFVLPGASRLDAELHACRTVCRRAERRLVALSRKEPVPPEAIRYLNRLSDALFVWGRWANLALGAPESLWDPNEAASASSTSGHQSPEAGS